MSGRARALALAAPVLFFAGTIAFAGSQIPGDPAARLAAALDRMDGVAVRLEMRAVAQAKGSEALGGSFSQTIRAVGELVPPDRLHLVLEGAGAVEELVIVGSREWIDAGDGFRAADKVPLGPLTRPTAALDFVRGPGSPEFGGLGLVRGAPTYRVRIPLSSVELQARLRSDQPVDPDSSGIVEVEIGLFDGLIRRETFDVVEPADPFGGTGLQTIRTTYAIEYWDHGRSIEVREPQ